MVVCLVHEYPWVAGIALPFVKFFEFFNPLDLWFGAGQDFSPFINSIPYQISMKDELIAFVHYLEGFFGTIQVKW
jgi:hypothetical protein